MATPSVKDLWDIYSSARKHTNQDHIKTCALDLFLELCFEEIKEYGSLPIVYDMKSIVNQLCNEFMNDIIRITNSAEDDGDPAALETYLVKERGWLLLYVIYKNGIQGLTVGRDFSNLIVSLLPWCLKFKTKSEDLTLEDNLPSINSCFYHLHKSSKWLRTCQQRDKVVPSTKKSKHEKRGSNHRKKQRNTVTAKELDSTDSDQETLGLVTPHKSKKTRNIFRQNPYVDITGRTIHEELNASEEENEDISLALSRVVVDKKHMSPQSISELILDLLLDICIQDLNQISPSKVLSPSILPHLINVLTSFYPKSNVDNDEILASEWTKGSNIYFQRKLLRVILTLCSVIAVQQNGVNIIASHKVLQDLLDIAQQIYNLQKIKSEISRTSKKENGTSATLFDLDICFLSEIILSSIVLLDVIFQCLPLNLVFIGNAVHLVRDFDKGHGFTMLEFVLQQLDWLGTECYTYSDWSQTEPIKIISSFLSTLKSVKVNYIHSMKCLKSKHQRCKFSMYFNHHHNILGDAYIDFQNGSSAENQNGGSDSMCLIGAWCTFLLGILGKLECKLSRIETLRTLSQSGICCCMQIEVVVRSVLKCLPKFSDPVQKYALEIVNSIILDNFCGRKPSNVLQEKRKSIPFTCGVCFDRESLRPEFKVGSDSVKIAIDSGFSSHGFKPEENKPVLEPTKWRVSEMYKDILFSKNQQVAELTSKQLLTLVVNGNEDLKEELFFRVYKYTFSSFLGTLRPKSPCSSEEEHNLNIEFSKKVKVHCLSALPYLLEVESVLYEFLQNKGIGRICCLLEDGNLRNPVLKVFEALVVLDESRLTDADVIFPKQTEMYGDSPKNGLVIKAFIGGLASKTAAETGIGGGSADIEDFIKMFDNDHIQFCCQNFAHVMTKNITLLVDMWETCARICLHSKRFLFHFQNSPCLKIAENALMVIIKQILCYNKCDFREGSEDSGLDSDISKVPSETSCCYLKLTLLKSLLIVCSASYHSLKKKDGQEISMWRKLKESFQACSKLPPTKMKTICDIILLSAMPKKTTVLDNSKLEILSELFIKDDDIDDDEIRQLLHTTSEDDYDSKKFGEGGYYGDTECGSEETEIQTRSPENGSQRVIYPAVFRILIELIINVQKEDNVMDTLSQILHKLLQTLRASHKATMAVCNEGLLEDILTGFWKLLVEDSGGSSVRNCLLSLIQLLSQHRITAIELQKIFQLFNYSKIPQKILLSTLLSVVENSNVEPHYSVTFPCKRTQEVSPKTCLLQSTLKTKSQLSRSDSYGSSIPFFASVTSMIMVTAPDSDVNSLDLNETTTTQDVWHTAAMFLPAKGLSWPPVKTGFTVALWVQISEDHENVVKISKSVSGNHVYFSSSEVFGSKEQLFLGKQSFEISDCLHLVSIGNTEKMLEVWIHSSSGYLIVRLTTEYGQSSHLIKDAISKECLTKGRWHHLVLSYTEGVQLIKGSAQDNTSQYVGKVSLLLDGWKSQEIKLEHPKSNLGKDTSGIYCPLLCVGHVSDDPECTSQTVTLSSLMIFEGSNQGKDELFHLYALGPSCVSVSKCDNVDMDMSYGSLLTRQMEQHSKIPADILVGSKGVDLDSLRSSLILSYNPLMPDLACFYREAENEMQTILASNLGLSHRHDRSLLSQQPITAQFTCQGKVIGHRHYSLEKAVEGAGGMEAALFLVAKVFELNKFENQVHDEEQEKLQSKSLQILFALVNHSTYLTKDYLLINGNQLLNRVLTSSRSVIGYYTLKVILDAATSESMLRFEPDGTLIMRRKSEAMITNVSVLNDLLLNWRVWEGADNDLLVMIFRALASLVREDHPHQHFNLKQFQSVNLINKIFKNYQERIQENMVAYSAEVAQSVISILQSMLGTPPDLHLIMAICDFLLLVHPATNSYINHTKSSFYFTAWWKEKSPRKRKESVYVKHSKHITSTPHKLEEQSSEEKLEIKAKKNFGWEDKVNEDSENDSTLKAQEYEKVKFTDGEIVVDELRKLKHSKDEEGPIETVSDLEKSDSQGSNVTNKSDENEHTRQRLHSFNSTTKGHNSNDLHILGSRRRSLTSNGSRRPSHSSSEGESLVSEKLSKASILKKIGVYASSGSLSREMSTDDEEGLYAPRPEVDFDVDDDEIESEKGLVALCVGLLETLTNIVITLPDNQISNVFQKVIKPDIALILAHHSSPQIRTAVIQVIHGYLSRAGEKQIEEFMQKQSFHLLGVQLHHYPTHAEQIDEVVSFILGRPYSFEMSSTIEGDIDELHDLQQAAIVVYLSLIENTYKDMALCHNTLTLTIQLFENSDVISSIMLENRIIEVITNLVASINSITTRSTDIDGIDEYQLIIEDIQLLLCKIAVREFRCTGAVHYQQCEEILDMLKLLEYVEETVYGKHSKQVSTVKNLQFVVASSVLTFIERESHEGSKSNATSKRSKSENSTSPNYGRSIASLFPSNSRSAPSFQYLEANRVTNFVDQPFEVITIGTSGERKSALGQKPKLVTRAFSTDSKPVGIFGSLFGFGRKKRFEFIPFSQSEFIDRVKKWLVTAVDLIVLSRTEEVKKTAGRKKLNMLVKSEPISIETSYIRKLFEFMYRAFEVTMAHDRILPRKEKNLIMWGAKDVIRVQIGRLMKFMLSPRCTFEDRTFLLSYIQGEVRGREIVRSVLTTNPDMGTEMACHIYDICTTWRDWLISQQRDFAHQFLNLLKSEKIQIFSPNATLTESQLGQLNDEKRLMSSRLEQGRELARKKKRPVFDRLKTRNDKLFQDLSKLAMDVTQNVTQLQTVERNKMIEHVKKKMTENIQTKKLWQELVQSLTHERAAWYCERSYPNSWQLDPTEGPGRVRKRLKRCHLGLQSRFLLPEQQEKLEAEFVDPPLIYLFEDDHQTSDSAALIYQLYRNEKIQHTCKCTAVAPNSESKGELLIGENSVFFVADEAITDANYTQVLLGNKDQLSMNWPYVDIREIHKRWYQLRDSGIEIFLTNGKTCLLACESKQERDELYCKFMSFEMSNLITQTENLEDIQRSWKEGQMTNYDYLTHLNKIAGRSFNDLMQYPVFPFILKDYVSERLNLYQSESYRNLSKPISVQDESKEKKYKDNYEATKMEYDRFEKEDQSIVGAGPYHYGSHYSNSGIVLHFLVRLPPYTKMFVSYQDNNFDLPDRTFHNMETCWRLASFQSSTDFKEMIPEFFFQPEFLKNSEGFDFGKRQNNEVVSDVTLPPWCKNNPRLFIIIMRQALESDYVRQNLHHWIDLVFGYKQQGEAAIRAINVFHPATYFGIDVDRVKDKLKRHALKTMVNTYGQTPKQLFKNPHLQGTAVKQNTSKVISQLVQQSFSVSMDTDFDHGHTYVPSPLDCVDGLKWGNYIGSPAYPPPKIVWQEKKSQVIASLLPLPSGDVIGVGEDTCCLTMHSKQKTSTLYNTTDVIWAAIVTWKFPDGVLRINNKPDQPFLNLIHHSPYDRITYVAAMAECPFIFVGCESGSITVYQTVFNIAKESDIQIKGVKHVLYGHTGKITQIVICKAYSIFVSCSEDRTCIIWDLNRLSYVRSIEGYKYGVDVVSISPTSGDIASSCRQGLGSCLHLHSINAEHIATYISQDHVINCLAFSKAPEGQSVNVIAGGLDNGVIRLWSTLDLRHLRDLQSENLMLTPVISVAFTHDSQRLYSTSSDGTVALWESPSSSRHLLPHKFVAFL